MLKPKFFAILRHRDAELPKKQIIKDVVAGAIVAIIALPLSVALAIASGVSPEKGLVTAIVAGFIVSLLGGSRVQIGGPTGAFVVIIYGIVMRYGVQGLTVATIMAGLIMVFLGLMRFGTVIKYVPYPTITGFTSGIAVVLFSTQVKDFFGLPIKEIPTQFIDKWHVYLSNFQAINYITAAVALISLLIIILWRKINSTIPGSIVALVVATISVKLFHLPVETIGSRFGEISNSIGFVDLHGLLLPLSAIQELLPAALTIAFLASIESLLSAVVADGMIGKKHSSNMELVAQGVANIASALLGGIPATGAIARTAANVKNGGRTPLAGIVHSLVLLLILLLFMPFAKLIPMATLSAILIMIAYNMSEWRSFKGLLTSTKSDITVLLVTFTLTVCFDLVIAIEFGMIIAMCLFVRRMSENTLISNISSDYKEAHQYIATDEDDEDDYSGEDLHKHLDSKIILYEINGPLFFGMTNSFNNLLTELSNSVKVVIFRMKLVTSMDATALNALKQLEKWCKERKIVLLYSELNAQPIKLLSNSGYMSAVGEKSFFETTDNALISANSIIDKLHK